MGVWGIILFNFAVSKTKSLLLEECGISNEETGFRRNTRKYLLKDGIVYLPCGPQLCSYQMSYERTAPHFSGL